MVGALAYSLRKNKKGQVAIFLVALAATFIALRISCSRIGLIAAPLLSAIIFLVNWRAFGWKSKLVAFLLVGLAAFSTMRDPSIAGRFQEMGVAHGNINNDLRKTQWIQGLAVFRDHPLLGSGPGAVPSPPLEMLPKNLDGSPVIPWKPYSPSHQVLINVLAESGMLGMIAFLALHLSPLILIRKNLFSGDPEIFFWSWSAMAVAGQFLLNSLTDQVFGLRPLMYIYWTTTAVALWLPAYKASLPRKKAELASLRPAPSLRPQSGRGHQLRQGLGQAPGMEIVQSGLQPPRVKLRVAQIGRQEPQSLPQSAETRSLGYSAYPEFFDHLGVEVVGHQDRPPEAYGRKQHARPVPQKPPGPVGHQDGMDSQKGLLPLFGPQLAGNKV
jgi:hypothetical protein